MEVIHLYDPPWDDLHRRSNDDALLALEYPSNLIYQGAYVNAQILYTCDIFANLTLRHHQHITCIPPNTSSSISKNQYESKMPKMIKRQGRMTKYLFICATTGIAILVPAKYLRKFSLHNRKNGEMMGSQPPVKH